jgi:glutamyl-tRNA reductase
MNLAVVGLTHKTAPVEVREKLSIPEPQYEGAIAQLCAYPHIEEVAVLSTCNRLEIYLVLTETEPGIREVMQFLAEHSKLPIATLRPYLFSLLHQDAVMHVMRVSGGLDSLVLGEGQILSQVKHCHQCGQKYNGTGRTLNQLLKQAIGAGKRVRTETSIGTGAVSISSAAVELALIKVDRQRFENLADLKTTIVGAGKMSVLLVKHLVSKGAGKIVLMNRTQQKAIDLAKQFPEGNITVLPVEDMLTVIADSDLVFTSTSATGPILDRSKLEALLDPAHPLLVVDISVPRNVDADVNDLDNVRAFDVDDLKAVVEQNQESRRQMALEAEAILEEEVDAFDNWLRSLETVSTISSLRDKVETIRTQELEKALSRLGSEFGDKHQEIIEALTRGIVNKILHDPMVQLRSQRDIDARRQAMDTLSLLFNLEDQPQSKQQARV